MQRLAMGMAFCLAAIATTAMAQEVYQWKDAKGVTQYTSTPPPKGAYTVRAFDSNVPPPPAQTAKAAPAENQDCVTARKNLELLKSDKAVRMDSDGDGKPDKSLSDTDRASQTELAQATLKANCTAASPAKP